METDLDSNNSLHSFFEEKHRISGLNLFVEGCRPEWEDKLNYEGMCYTLEYLVKNEQDIDRFLQLFKESWLKLMLSLVGESIDAAKYVYFTHIDQWGQIH